MVLHSAAAGGIPTVAGFGARHRGRCARCTAYSGPTAHPPARGLGRLYFCVLQHVWLKAAWLHPADDAGPGFARGAGAGPLER